MSGGQHVECPVGLCSSRVLEWQMLVDQAVRPACGVCQRPAASACRVKLQNKKELHSVGL